MGNFTRPFPFLSPFSELCLALVQASCETWEYWVSSPAYVIPNVNASSTYIINCSHFTHYSLSCSLCSLTSCLTNKLELCSASKWSLRRPPWHSAAFPKPLQVIESPVRHMSTSIFFLPFSVQHFVWTELNLVWHYVTHSSTQIRSLWSCSQTFQNLSNSIFFADLVDSQPRFFQIFLEYPGQPRRSCGSLNNLNGKFLLWGNIYLNLLSFFPASVK